MSLSVGKSPAFLLLLSLLAIFSPAVVAQNTISDQSASAESQSPIAESEPEANADLPLEKMLVDEATSLPKILQNDDRAERNGDRINDTETIEKTNEFSEAFHEAEANDFAYRFPPTGARERHLEFKVSPRLEKKKFSFETASASKKSFDDTKNLLSSDDAAAVTSENFRWRSAIGQSLMFLAVQHGYAFTQPKTREAMKGKFWKDYVDSVKSLHGWADGGRFFTNYIAHPMQGSLLGFVQIQNDPRGMKQKFGTSGDYWRSRLKAMAWSAAWSTQFEIGPISQASIGNVGLKGKQTYIDIVVTPTVGTALLIGEDAVDRFVMQRIERASDNFYVRIFSRMLLSPTRVFANLLRFKPPWHRDRPVAR